MLCIFQQLPATKRGWNLKCPFCKQNGEPEEMWSSHELRDATGRVTCPILFKYRCSQCGATGPKAHTLKYCPATAAIANPAVDVIKLKQTARQASESFLHQYFIFITIVVFYCWVTLWIDLCVLAQNGVYD